MVRNNFFTYFILKETHQTVLFKDKLNYNSKHKIPRFFWDTKVS